LRIEFFLANAKKKYYSADTSDECYELMPADNFVMALNPANILHRQVIHTDSESGGESFRQQE
jgi:hypothetical protein